MLHRVFTRACNSLLSFSLVVLLSGMMSACGLRGDLYLPDQRPKPASKNTTQPVTKAPDQAQTDQDKKDKDKQAQDENATATDSSGTTDGNEMK